MMVRVVGNSKLPVWMGNLIVGHPFAAWTFMFWVFVPGKTVTATVLHHESRHVQQFLFITGCVMALFALMLHPAWYAYPIFFVLSHPIAMGVASVIATLRGGHIYRDNWFEKDARHYAGEE